MGAERPTGCRGQALDRLCGPGRSQNLFGPTTLVAACTRPALGLTGTKTPHALTGSHQKEVSEQWKLPCSRSPFRVPRVLRPEDI